ncbi:MAG: hypothetical protein SFZ23_09635 [Planctomycetota bacterium]|nr:hypothetical protein [Planctomycetota bacterium]
MRIPVSKVWRAFAELDDFSDEECRTFVLRVQMQRRVSLVGPVLVGAGVLVAALAGAVFAIKPMNDWLLSALGYRFPAEPDWILFGVPALTFVAFPVMLAFLAGAFVRDRQLIRAIRERLLHCNCPQCRQSLLGLPVVHGATEPAVRCPECGNLLVLAQLGLSREDIIQRSLRPDGQEEPSPDAQPPETQENPSKKPA